MSRLYTAVEINCQLKFSLILLLRYNSLCITHFPELIGFPLHRSERELQRFSTEMDLCRYPIVQASVLIFFRIVVATPSLDDFCSFR